MRFNYVSQEDYTQPRRIFVAEICPEGGQLTLLIKVSKGLFDPSGAKPSRKGQKIIDLLNATPGIGNAKLYGLDVISAVPQCGYTSRTMSSVCEGVANILGWPPETTTLQWLQNWDD